MKPKSDPGPGNTPRAEIPAAQPRTAAVRGEVAAAAILAAGVSIERFRTPRAFAAVPVVLVNYVAFRAQLRFWQAHLDRADAFLVSVTLESIAVYWAWLAAKALLANDSSLRPRLAAYCTALVIGALNYSHFCKPDWRPTVAAVTFGGMSVISPWLWGAYTRRVHRDELKARDLIEDHAVRLGLTRWFWWARRCIGVQRLAAWEGINSPAAAIALYDQRRAARAAAKAGRRGGDQARSPAPPAPAPAATAPQTPPPAHSPREPRPSRVSVKARTGELAAVSAGEQAIVLKLIQAGKPLPGINRLCGTERIGAPKARRVLKLAAARMNGGGGHDDHDAS